MREEELIFNIGFIGLLVAALITTAFHVTFNSDEKNLKKKNQSIVALEQDLANASVKFSALVQPDVLRNIVAQTHQNYKPIGTDKVISLKSME